MKLKTVQNETLNLDEGQFEFLVRNLNIITCIKCSLGLSKSCIGVLFT